jgi:O-antigen ligase
LVGESVNRAWSLGGQRRLVIDSLCLAIAYFTVVAWGSNEPWAMGIIVVASIGLLALRIAWDVLHGNLRIPRASIFIPLVLFLIYAAVQLRFGTVEKYSTALYLLLALSYVSILYLAATGFQSRGAVKFLVMCLLILGSFEAVYGLVQYLGEYNYIWDFYRTAYQGLATGTLINRNHYALLMNLSICTAVGYLYYRSIRLLKGEDLSLRRILGVPGSGALSWIVLWIALMGLALMFSMSRMGIAAMFASIGVMMIAAKATRSGKRTAALGLLLIFAICSLAIYTGIDEIMARYEAISKQRESDRDRVALWRDAWKMIEKHPVFGQGLGSFQWTFPAYESIEPDIPARYAHNDYLQTLAEMGILGLSLLVWAFGAAWKVAIQNLKNNRDPLVKGIGLGTVGVLTAIALQEITDFGLYIPGVAMIAAVLIGLNLRVRASALSEAK